MREFIRLNQAAARLGVHVTTVRGWVRDGRVPAYRVGQRFTRVDWNELVAAIETHSPTAGSVHRQASVDAHQPDEVERAGS